MELTKQNSQLANTGPNSKQIDIAKAIYDVNLFMQYPLPDSRLEDWAKCIDESFPELEVETIKEVMKKFKNGTYFWDNQLQIQNLIMRLKPKTMVY